MTKSTSLGAFLRQRAAIYEAEARKDGTIIPELLGAIANLFGQIREWLDASDPDGMLRLKEGKIELSERGLGRYRVPRLDILAFGERIGIVPEVRLVAGMGSPPPSIATERPAGLVGIADGVRRYWLYRFRGATGDRWFVESSELAGNARLLTRSLFEEILLSYLQ